MAEEVLGFSAHADFSDLYSKLNSVIEKFKESSTRVEELKEELRKLAESGASAEVLVKKTKELADAQSKAANAAADALEANGKYWTALNNAGKDISDVQKAHSELNRAYQQFREEAKQSKEVIKEYTKTAQDSGEKIQETSKETTSQIKEQNEEMSRSLDKVKDKILGLVAVWSAKEFANKVMETRGAFQQLEVAFTTMLGSAEQANELMQQLTKTAAITPFDLQGVTQGAKQLLAYGIAADEVNDTLIHLGDIAAGLSLPLNDLVYLYGTTMTQGRMFTQDLRQFMGRGIPIAEELAKQFGVTKDKVGELVTAGKVGAEEFKQAIMSMSSEGGKFAGLMEAQSKTITGQISNIEDAIDGMFNEIGKQNEGVINGVLSTVSSLVENYERVGKVLMALVATYGAYKAAIITVTAIEKVAAAQKGIETAATAAATGAKVAETAATVTLSGAEMVHYGKIMLVQKAHALLNATMLTNPYVLVTAAVVGLVAALATMKTEEERVNDALEEYNRIKDETIAKEKEHRQEIEELIQIASDESLSTDARKTAMISLMDKYPQLFKDYKTEIEALKDIAYWKAKIVEIESGKSITLRNNELYDLNKQINDLEKKGAGDYKTDDYGNVIGWEGRTKDEEAQLKAFKKRREQLNKEIKKEGDNKYLEDLTGVSNEDLQKQINQRKNLIAKIQVQEQANKDKGEKKQIKGQTTFGGIVGVYSKEELESQLTSLQWELNRRNEITKNKNKDFKEEQNKALKDAKKRLDEWKKLSDPSVRAQTKGTVNDKEGGTLISELSPEEWQKELENREKAVQEAQKRIGKKGSGKGDNAAEKKAKQEEDLAKQRHKQQQEEARQRILTQRTEEEAVIAEMQNGSAKELKQMELDHQKRKDEIERERQQMLEKNIEYAAAEYNKKRGKGQAGFYAQGLEKQVSLSEEQEKYLKSREEVVEVDYRKIVKERYEYEVQSMRNYLIEYGTYQQKKKAIEDKYNKLIEKAEGNLGEQMRLQAEKRSKQAELDMQNLQKEINWEVVFGNLDSLSTKAMEKLRDKLREALSADNIDPQNAKVLSEKILEIEDKISAKTSVWASMIPYLKERERISNQVALAAEREAAAEKESLKAQADLALQQWNAKSTIQKVTGKSLTDKQLNGTEEEIMTTLGIDKDKDKEKYDAVSKALDKLKLSAEKAAQATGALAQAKQTKQDWESIFNGKRGGFLGTLGGVLKDAAEKGGGGFWGWTGVGAANLGSMGSLAEQLGFSGDDFEKISTGVNDAMGAVTDFASGNYIGALTKGISAINSLGEGIGLWSNSNVAEMEAMIDRLEKSNAELGKALDDLRDEMHNTNLADTDAYERAQRVANAQIENGMRVVWAKMNEYDGHHSTRYYSDYATGILYELAQKAMNAGKIDQKYIGEAGYNTPFGYVGGQEINDILKYLTPADLDAIRSFNPEGWIKFMDALRDADKADLGAADTFLEYVDTYADTLKDLETEWKETLLNLSWDSLKSSFASALEDMEKSVEDWNDDLTDIFKKGVANYISTKYTDKDTGDLAKWYDKYYKAMESEGLTTDEIKGLREEYLAIVKAATEERDQLFKTLGITDQDQQSATFNSAQNITYEQADSLVGIATAQLIVEEQSLTQFVEQTGLLAMMQVDMRATAVDVRGIAEGVTTMVETQGRMNNHLAAIELNTNVLPEMAEEIVRIRKKIDEQ